MANYERRGVYEPNDEVRVFDGSEDDEDVEGSRLPLLIVLALLVLAMFGGVVWLAYTQGVARGRGETPVLTAAAGPEKVAPQQPGGANVPYQGFKIYEQPAPPDDVADTAPDAAKPAPPAEKSVAAAPVDAPKPVPAPITAPPPSKPAQVAGAPPTPAAAKPAAAAPAKPAAPLQAAHPAATAPQPAPKSMAALIQQSNSGPAAAPAPVGGPATAGPRQLSGSAVGAPHQLAAPAAPAKVAAATPAAKPVGGGYVLQIGSYKSQADADAAWKAYKGKHAALLSGYNSDVQQADLGAKGTWYRLRVGGLAEKEVATGLCERLKADGGACILGR